MSTEHSEGVSDILLAPQVIHRALASLDQAVVAIDPHGEIVYWDAQAERLYGYRAEEAIGRPLSDLVASPSAVAAAAAWRTRLLPGRSCTGDWPVRDKAGRRFVASVTATAVIDDHGQAVALIGVSSDVSRRRRDETRARMLAAVVEGCRDAIIETDPRGVVLTTNPAAEAVYGQAPGELVGRDVAALTAADDASTLTEAVISADASDGVRQVKARRPDGSSFDLTLIVSPAHDGTDAVGLRRAEPELRRPPLHDDLTGLPNRKALEGRLDRAVVRQHRRNRSVAVLSAGLDQFKLVNQSKGHPAGDVALAEVARRFAAAVRPEDTLGRFSSDIFGVVCAESSAAEAGDIAVRLQQTLAEPFDVDGQAVYLSACVGVALCPPNAAPELLRCAETAMHWAKAAGPGTVRTFERALADEGAARLALSNDLREALLRDTLALHYQPVVDLHDGRILGVEALARWHHPRLGPISPTSFVGIAETTGLGPALGRWALNRACREATRLAGMNPTPLRVAVNISAAHLADPALEEAVLTAIRGSRLADGGLVLEITETSVMGDPTQARELLQRLRAFGVETAIDHFGTGHSSMAHLSRLPVSTLKIDRSFVRGITNDPDSLAITESIINLAHTMRLTVVAMGIETAEQFKLLRRLGCDAGQGFLFSPGVAPGAFGELVGRLAQARYFDAEPEPAPAAVGPSQPELAERNSSAPR